MMERRCFMFREYIPLKMPEGMAEGLIFSRINAKQLEVFGDRVNLKRRKFEPFSLYKIRIRNKAITELN